MKEEDAEKWRYLHFADKGAHHHHHHQRRRGRTALWLYLALVRLTVYVLSSRLFAYNGMVCV